MWDSGLGPCVVCHKTFDRDILGRCESCFRLGANVPYGRFIEMGVENPVDPKGSTAHVRDIKQRRLDPKTKQMYYDKAPKTYFY